MVPRLVLVEGIPFTGKSTLSEFVAQQLNNNNFPAKWVGEGVMLQCHFTHVLATLEDKQVVDETSMRTDWNMFVQTVMSASETFVVDAALSFAAIYPLLRADRPTATILAELQHIAELCAPLHPRVIHLTGDVNHLAPASIVERGERWEEHMVRQSDTAPYQQARGRSGVAGATEFLRDAQALTHMVLEAGKWQHLTLDVVATNWAANRRAVLDFLEIAEVVVADAALTHEELRSYEGAYLSEDPDDDEILTVRLEQDRLVLYGPGIRIGPLAPLTATRFHVMATRLDTEFVVEETQTQRLVVFTSDGATHSFRRLQSHET